MRSVGQHYADPDDRTDIQSEALVAAFLKLPSSDPSLGEAITDRVAARFRWTDGVSAYLSDAYRGGMIVNFFLLSLAIGVG